MLSPVRPSTCGNNFRACPRSPLYLAEIGFFFRIADWIVLNVALDDFRAISDLATASTERTFATAQLS
jgi:hypothetical protein